MEDVCASRSEPSLLGLSEIGRRARPRRPLDGGPPPRVNSHHGEATKSATGLIQQTKERALARNKARLAELMALIRRRLTEVVEGFYDIGEALREIVDHKLYAAMGHKSLGELLKAEGLISLRQATKLIAVVRKTPREQALALGQERAYALVAYTEATPEPDSPAQLLAEGANVGGKPAKDASVRDILAATRGAREKARAARPKSAAEREKTKADAALEVALRTVLREAGIGRAQIAVGTGDVRITIARSTALRITRGR
jgi:hypothetical protein